jgi:hypothetical protein
MKKMKVSILALSVLVGGAVFASAANNSLTIANTADISLTNAVPLVWSDVYRIPTSVFLANTNSQFSGVVDTDSGGKISGVGNLIKSYYDASGNLIGRSSFYTTVKGKISASKMAQPTVQMTLKGEGYTAPAVSNALVIIDKQTASAFPGKLNLTFNAKNTVAVSNNFEYHILGTLKGTVQPGLAAVNSKTIKIDETAADLVVNRNSMGTLDMRVLLYGTKFAAILWNTDASGQGNINKNNGQYTLNLKSASGGSSSLKAKGTIVAVASPGSTNSTISTINTADITGKIDGQAVQSTGYRFSSFAD